MKNLRITILIYILFSLSSTVFSQNATESEYFKEDFPQSTSHKRTEAIKLFELGEQQYEKGEYALALEYLNEALHLMPDHSMAYYYRASAKEHLNDIKGAITDYNILIHFDPTMNEAFFNRGMLRYKLEDYSGAIEDFTTLLSMPAPNTQAVYFKSTSYGDGGPGATGIITMYSKDADIYNYLGLSRTKLGDIERALKDFNKALQINATDANIFVNRGLAYAANNEQEFANNDFRKALEIEPDHAIALFNLTMASDDTQKDIALYDQMISKNEDFPSAYINRGLIKFRAGKFEEALTDYNTAVKLDPSNTIALLNRALTYEKLERYTEAIKDLDKTIQLDPDLDKAYSSRGNVYFKIQDFESALQDYNHIISLAANDASLFYNRALVKYKLKLKDEACQDLKYAIEQGYDAAQKALNAYCK